MSQTLTKNTKSKKIRCNVCHKRISITFIECKCGQYLCMSHRYVDSHECQYDHKSEWIKQFRKNNPIIKNPKVEPI
jgi:hypothetical protein